MARNGGSGAAQARKARAKAAKGKPVAPMPKGMQGSMPVKGSPHNCAY